MSKWRSNSNVTLWHFKSSLNGGQSVAFFQHSGQFWHCCVTFFHDDSQLWPYSVTFCPRWRPLVTSLCEKLKAAAKKRTSTLTSFLHDRQLWRYFVTHFQDGDHLWRHSVTFFQDGSRPWRHMNHAAPRGGVSRRQGRPPTVTPPPPPLDMRQPTSTPPMQRPAVGGYPPAGSSPVVGYPPASTSSSPLPAGRAEAAGERRLFSRNFNGTCEYTWLFFYYNVYRSMPHTIIMTNFQRAEIIIIILYFPFRRYTM